jgi:GLPGLI family protein
MKKIAITLVSLLFLGNCLFAQHAHFTTSGTIEFEKKVNLYALIKKEVNADNEAFMKPLIEEFMKQNPQFKTLKSTLSFTGNKTLFVPAEEELAKQDWGIGPMEDQNNTIYTDFTTNGCIDQKKVFDETFLVKDTARAIKWKITDETRQIAGYTCRRANAIMMDSIYVVAFYTTEIPVTGGPESFNGLPGMILGVALPHDNLTWFATKVTDTTLPPNTVVAPKKGKVTDNNGLKKTLHDATKDWGKWANRYLEAFQL